MIAAVFDTNTLLQGILSENGPAGQCVKLVDDGRIQLYFSWETFEELQDVISRPVLRRKFPVLSSNRAEIIIHSAAENSIFVSDPPKLFSLDRDRNDEKFVDLALAAKAEYIVTRDKDLLDLTTDREFCEQYPDLKIITPVGLLEILRKK